MPELPPNVRVLSSLPEDHAGFDLSEQRFIEALSRAEDDHFWHRARNELITARLRALGVAPPARVLELGCGSGCVAAHLAREGYRVTGVEGHAPLVARAAARAPGASFVLHDLGRGTAALGLDPFDAVGLFDVIEHLDDPARALNEALGCAAPGGLVVGTVPAMMSLWSPVDAQAGHRLRYDRTTLGAVLGELPGADVVEVAPFNRLLVPMLWAQRRLVVKPGDTATTSERNLAVPPRPLNALLHRALAAEAALSPWLDTAPLPGASLWFALRKQNPG